MPFYDYKCRKCDNIFEEMVPIATSDDAIRCPRCGALDSERQISAPSISKGKNGAAPMSPASCAHSKRYS
ncbi:MAG: zinc ribbon domain-containing protein [Candidatus Eisenbacteria bacterium]|uniref:Zinc ribbon domain-containing protein n=1 Tax=Eiseniibacteriota bacterium TaxID=2212470 RepID=A0A948RZK9_UNCEI|nr:zinc ribbon domain-containing protein [Candidatus Eisenbacteria bacterium]MBU1949564.1 zinc ribbon domain-containing protein [Candidatus Eisenbacteria bacterium]MBU2692097.1 zinc ribbon domain-containing protein [Candidatus Eisenbacteria bacterium]